MQLFIASTAEPKEEYSVMNVVQIKRLMMQEKQKKLSVSQHNLQLIALCDG